MKLSIVIPAYNEEKRIGARLRDLIYVFEKLRKENKLDYEIIVVINRSTDKTEEIVLKFKKNNSRINYLHLKEKGKGLAVTTGFKEALKRNNDYIGFVDADLATTGEEYARLFFELIKIKTDGLIASRYLPGAKVNPKPTLKRIISSRIYNAYIRILFWLPFRDTQCGAKIFKRRAIEKIANKLISTKFAFDVDVLFNLKKENFVVVETPTVWSDKAYSKVSLLKDGIRMGLSMLRLRVLNSPFAGIMKIYDSLPASLKIKI